MTAKTHSKTEMGWLLLALFGIPCLLMLAKSPRSPISTWLIEHASLVSLPAGLQHKLTHILFVPLGAILVVLVRLTLGLRVLGPFRSILLAVAFQATGAVLGLVFLAVTIAIVASIRPLLRAMALPYFGRITVMLSSVAVLITLGVMGSQWFHVGSLQSIVYFPIVVLCLVADAFARTASKEGLRSALWRAGTTALTAVGLAALADHPQLTQHLLLYPELLVLQIGCIIVISRYMNWKCLEWLNPAPSGTHSVPEKVQQPA
jgi:hypothetical protein